MNLLPSEDDRDIAENVAALVARDMPISALHADGDPGRAVTVPAAWNAFAESGLLGLGIPDEHGGVGLGAVAEVMAFRELGRQLAPGPFLASVIGARVAVQAGRDDLVEQIVSGAASVCLLVARSDVAEDGILDGVVQLIDAPGAEWALLLTAETVALYPLHAFDDVVAVASIDPGVKVARATATGVAPAVLSPSPADAYFQGVLLLSAFLVGIAEAVTTASTEHAITREQFGRPIGVNQAIKHACATMAVNAEAARSQVFYAAASIEADRPDAPDQISIAWVIASDAAIAGSQANIQVHGGMGYTAEHDAHLFVKRARVLAPLLGGRRAQLDRILEREPSA